MQIIRNRKTFDVCIVGSGAGGGMAAKVLTEAGADLVLLEAGAPFDPAAKQALLEADTLSGRAELTVQLMQFFGRHDSDEGTLQ